jgi:hypothetical protein
MKAQKVRSDKNRRPFLFEEGASSFKNLFNATMAGVYENPLPFFGPLTPEQWASYV